MPLPIERRKRIEKQLLHDMSSVLLHDTSDPRFHGISLSDVDLAPDGRSVNILIHAQPNSDTFPQTIKALNKASGFFRTAIARRMDLKITPRIRFIVDKKAQAQEALMAVLEEL